MIDRLRRRVSRGMVLCLILSAWSTASAQESPDASCWIATLQVSDFPLYWGDFSNQAYNTWGMTGSIGYAPSAFNGHLLGAIVYTHAPRYEDSRQPLLNIAALTLRYAFSSMNERGFNTHLSLAAEWMGVDGMPRTFPDGTVIPDDSLDIYCFECTPDYKDASIAAAVPGVGFDILASTGLGVGGDVRLHIPLNVGTEVGESRFLWLELALGMVYRF